MCEVVQFQDNQVKLKLRHAEGVQHVTSRPTRALQFAPQATNLREYDGDFSAFYPPSRPSMRSQIKEKFFDQFYQQRSTTYHSRECSPHSMSPSPWKIPLQAHEMAKVDQFQLRKEQSWHPQRRTNWWVQMLTMTMTVFSANTLYHPYRSCIRGCMKAVRPECEASDQTEWSRNSVSLDRTKLSKLLVSEF